MADRDLIGFVYNPRVPEAVGLVDSLVKSLGLQEKSWTASAAELQTRENMLAKTSLIVTAGGDGTILRAVRVAAPYSVPIVGINLGRVGFMTELSVEEAAGRLQAYISGEFRVEERMMMQASITSGSGEGPAVEAHALNDVVVTRAGVARVMDIDVAIDGASLTTYRADAVIAATATGSTGYALSAGGPIVDPEARLIMVRPVAPHISFQPGVVVAKGSVIELGVRGEREVALVVDGFVAATLGPTDRVVVQRSPHVARFLRAGPPSAFYATLTERLGLMDLRAPPKS